MTARQIDDAPGDVPRQGSSPSVGDQLRELLAMIDRDELSATPAERGFVAGALAAMEAAAPRH